LKLEKDLYRIILPYACAGIILQNNVVTDTAPIFKWMKGKTLQEVENWVSNKKGTIQKVEIIMNYGKREPEQKSFGHFNQ
jgi:hypothetical protein